MKLLLSTMALFMSFSAFSETIVRLLDVREDYFNSVKLLSFGLRIGLMYNLK